MVVKKCRGIFFLGVGGWGAGRTHKKEEVKVKCGNGTKVTESLGKEWGSQKGKSKAGEGQGKRHAHTVATLSGVPGPSALTAPPAAFSYPSLPSAARSVPSSRGTVVPTTWDDA